MNIFRSVTNIFSNPLKNICGNNKLITQTNTQFSVIPCRTKYVDWRMLRDVKRRRVVKEYAQERLHLNVLHYNTLLPKDLRVSAKETVAALPTDSCITKLHKRCILTSRPRGRFRKFRMSRIIWRHLADYNQISGVERAMW